MLKNFQKQNGSTLIIIIIVLVIVAVVGLSFVFWNNTHSSSSTPKASSPANTNTTPKPEHLSLTDWSIGFNLPSGLKLSDVYYYKTHVGDGPDYYGFTTSRVRAQGGACDNQVTGNLVTLTRSTSNAISGTLINDTAIGGYYYYSGSSVDDISPTPACLQTDIALQDHGFLSNMVKTLSAK